MAAHATKSTGGLRLQHELTPLLVVFDVQRSMDFYARAFGFQKTDEYVAVDGVLYWAKVKRGDAELMFSKHTRMESGEARNWLNTPHAVLYLQVNDVLGLLAHLKKEKLMPDDVEPVVTGYGKKEITVRDPDGFEIWCGQDTDDPPTPEGR